MTSRELTSAFDFWSHGHLRMAVMHLHIKFGADIFIQSGVIDIFPKLIFPWQSKATSVGTKFTSFVWDTMEGTTRIWHQLVKRSSEWVSEWVWDTMDWEIRIHSRFQSQLWEDLWLFGGFWNDRCWWNQTNCACVTQCLLFMYVSYLSFHCCQLFIRSWTSCPDVAVCPTWHSEGWTAHQQSHWLNQKPPWPCWGTLQGWHPQ